MTDTLKPCPFCGESVEITVDEIICKCGLAIYSAFHPVGQEIEVLREKWNTRTPEPHKNLAKLFEPFYQAIKEKGACEINEYDEIWHYYGDHIPQQQGDGE